MAPALITAMISSPWWSAISWHDRFGHKSFEGKAAIQRDAYHSPFPVQRLDASDQMVAGAALGGKNSDLRQNFP